MAATALIIGDLQNGVVANFGNYTDLLGRARRATDAARAAAIPVIFVRVGFRPGHPEISPANQMFSGVAKAGVMLQADTSTQLHDGLGVQPDDIVVVKRRVSAFNGTDLDMLLRARGIDSIVIGGIATSGVVLSTVRHAADLDYRITVLSDITRDADAEVHDVLIGKVFPRQATVTTVDAWAASLIA